MELINYHQLVIQGMFHLNELTTTDIVWFKSNAEIVHALISNPIPQGLDFNLDKELVIIENICTQDNIPKYCIAATYGYLEFIFIPLIFQNESQGLVRIGPFLTNPIANSQLSELLINLGYSLRQHQSIRYYYDSLKLVPSSYTTNLGFISMNLFGYTLPHVSVVTYQSSTKLPKIQKLQYEDINDIRAIEENYKQEKLLQYAISHNDQDLLKKVTDYFDTTFSIKERFPDNPLRSAKNLAIVSNTILRSAAQDGGVHPVYLHRISTKYALLIEQATTRTEVLRLHNIMAKDYAETVMKYAYNNVSPLIKKIIQYIQLNLDQPLTVTTLSHEFNINPPNLANLFKKNTNHTISDFVNTLRIKEACYLLSSSDLSISDIGSLVGINDANYFTRLFKQYQHVTPTKFRCSL